MAAKANGNVSKVKREEDEDDDLQCGYGPWKPASLQGCNNSRALLAVICFLAFIQSWVVMGIVNVNTATIERRFNMRSSQVAWITSSYDITAGVLAVVLGYMAGVFHKGRMMTAGAAFLALGSFVMIVPHLATDTYSLGAADTEQCDVYGNQTDAGCGEDGENLSSYLYVFILGQVLHGVGGVCVYTVGLTYIDDNVTANQTPLYIGIKYAFSALGAAFAFIGGGFMLNVYVDVGRVDMDDIALTPEDPGWVGAWWIGFAITSVAATICALLLACFPREFPGSRQMREERPSESHRGAGDVLTSEGSTWSNVKQAVLVIVTNPTWVCVSLAGLVESAAVNAVATFLPKFIQVQFTVTAAVAALSAGVVIIPGAAGGHVLGGAIPRCLNLRVRGLLILLLVAGVIGGVLAPFFLLRCDMADIAGVTVPYVNTSHSTEDPHIIHPCNANCSCSTANYQPVCGHNDVVYFSPCHAGCFNGTDGQRYGDNLYASCTCIPPPANSWAAEDKLCPGSCTTEFILFLVCLMVLLLVSFSANISGHVVTIRCVPLRYRGFAYGLQSLLIRLLGNVPGPLLLGLIFDSSCLLWQERCGETGSCWIYDSDSTTIKIVIALVAIKVFSVICFALALYFYKPPPDEEIIFDKDVLADFKEKDGAITGDEITREISTVACEKQLYAADSDEHFVTHI